MALVLPTVKDASTQQALSRIARQFPLGAENLKDVFVSRVAELPASGEEGQLVYDKTTHAFYGFNGMEWKEL